MPRIDQDLETWTKTKNPKAPAATRVIDGTWEGLMGTETPLAPRQHQYDVAIYIVLDQFGGALGRAYRETDESYADEHTTIDKISDGAYSRPVRVVAFNTHEGWSRDVTEEIALKLFDLSGEGRMLCATAREFVEQVTGKAPTPPILTAYYVGGEHALSGGTPHQ